MDKVTQCSDISLKQLDVIEDYDTGNGIVNYRVGRQAGPSRRGRVHTFISQPLPASGAVLLSANREDNRIYRHWSPVSQIFVGGDTLLTALDSGWEITGIVLRQQYLCSSNRCTYVYHVELHQNGERNSMKVVENPWITRLLHQLQVDIASETSPEF